MSKNKFIEIPAGLASLSKRKAVYGVGINDAKYITLRRDDNKKLIRCPYYLVWNNMLQRCYDPIYKKTQKTYDKCFVVNEWLVFSVFKKWMESFAWEGLSLDKDIKVIGNKIYSPDTCLFVSQEINNLLLDRKALRGDFPIGVTLDKRDGRYYSRCKRKSKTIALGGYNTPEQAHEAYKNFKNKVIIEAANDPENEYIKEYLLNHAAHLMRL